MRLGLLFLLWHLFCAKRSLALGDSVGRSLAFGGSVGLKRALLF